VAPEVRGNSATGHWGPAPFRAVLRPSWVMAFALLFVHLGAVGCLVALNVSLSFKLTIICAIVWSLASTLRHHAFRWGTNSVIEISWTRHGEWQIRRFSGQWQQGLALASAYVHPAATVICLQRGGRRYASLVIVSGMLDQSSFRRLRVRLRLEALQATASTHHPSGGQRIQK
jgi:hypothetical protein